MSSPEAILAYIVSQIEQNVNFLASQNYISSGDVSAIITRLPNANQNETGSPKANPNTGSRKMAPPPPPPIARSAPAPPTTNLSRALWAYNENGEDPNDLSFVEGDTIEIIDDSGTDWWTGKVNGKQGSFPSSYVEKLSRPGLAPKQAKKPYKPFGAALRVDSPGPDGVNSLGLKEEPQAGSKDVRARLDHYKSSVKEFGAGAMAIGGLVKGNLVKSIM